MTPTQDRIVSFLTNHVVLIGLTLRFFLAWFLPFVLDSGDWIPGVAYTDIDYLVFTDAAQHVSEGNSPYLRHTYRYTPFLAVLLSKWNEAGRYLFCLADTICGWLICKLRQQQRQQGENSLTDALWWMYNPLAINICTRGSAEPLVVLLPVLLTVWEVTDQQKSILFRATVAGVLHGIAVHSKLYPIIYSLSFMAYFGSGAQQGERQDSQSFPWNNPSRLIKLMWTWIKRLLSPAPLLFLCTFVLTTCSLTYLAVLWYGPEALEQSLLYHLSRVDHRHNYSIFWYFIYLARGRAAASLSMVGSDDMKVLGRVLLLPQTILLFYTSLGVAPHDLSLALFVQTFLFVAHNKVITAQYFTWYLCLLPLCSERFDWNNLRLRWALLGLGLSVITWLSCAYCLEIQGMAVHRLVWMASVLFFVANVNLMGALLQSYQIKNKRKVE